MDRLQQVKRMAAGWQSACGLVVVSLARRTDSAGHRVWRGRLSSEQSWRLVAS